MTMEKAPLLQQIVSSEEMKPMDPVYTQNKTILKPWIDAHQLKKIGSIWYKDRRQVVTRELSHLHTFIHAHHDSPVYGHPGINKTHQLTS